MQAPKQSEQIPAPSGARSGQARPASATSAWIIAATFASFLTALTLVRFAVRSSTLRDLVTGALICIASAAAVNFILDLAILKVHKRPSSGLDWSRNKPSWRRTFVKFLGLLGSLGFIGILYWIFPEYHGAFYGDYWALLRRILPWWMGFAFPYFYLIDARQKEPEDGYYQAGLAVLCRFQLINVGVLVQHLLGWLVKGYFLALIFTYFVGDLRRFVLFDFSTIRSFGKFYDCAYDFIFLIDVGFASVGYLLSFRLFDTHMRSTERTVQGWLVALACYEPFWSLLSRQYFGYARDFAWGAWLQTTPWLYCLWGTTILLLYVVYGWATVIFGCRFSNLTHRGILTNGPYRWTKHPAYLSKNLAFWLTFIPFIVSEGWADSLRRCAMLLLLNGVYYLRAKTEEAHLGRDPVYLQYAEWMTWHSPFRWLNPRNKGRARLKTTRPT